MEGSTGIPRTSVNIYGHAMTDPPGFIIVKYGDDLHRIFNPWCPNTVLLECIRQKSNCEKGVILDLVDLSGQVRHLSSKPSDYANASLTARQTYILIKIEQQEGDQPPRYTSMLNHLDHHHPEVFERLNSLSQTPVRNVPSRRSRWSAMRAKINVTRTLMASTGRSVSRTGRHSVSEKGTS